MINNKNVVLFCRLILVSVYPTLLWTSTGVDFRRQKANPRPLIINGEQVPGGYALRGPEMEDEHSPQSTAVALLPANTEEKQPVSRAASVCLPL